MRRLPIPLVTVWFLLPPTLSGQAGLAEWSVDPAPVLEVGVVDGLDTEMFIWALDAALLPDGGVVVLDAGASELRFFDETGDLVAVAGGAGEGPGEFIAPYGIEVVGDAVVAWDYRRRVLSSWSPAGEFLAERRIEHHTTFHEGALLPDGSVVIPYYGDQSVRAPPSGQYRPRAVLFRYVGGERQDLGSYPFEEMLVGQRVRLPSPYRSRSAVAAGGSPIQIYVGDDTNVPRVRWYDGTGALRDTLRLVDTRDEITRRGWSRMVDTLSLPPGQEKAARRGLAAWGRPDYTPAFEHLMADPEGRLWVISRALAGNAFAVVYEGGVAVARVDLPPVARWLEVGAERLVAVVIDELDVEMVHVFRYRRP